MTRNTSAVRRLPFRLLTQEDKNEALIAVRLKAWRGERFSD